MLEAIQSFDWSVLDGIQNIFACPFLDAAMPIVSRIGSAGAVWIVWAIVLICIKKYRRNGILMLCAIAAGFLIGNLIIKNIIARPRPFMLREGIELLVKAPSGHSFPSGHTLASTIGAVILTFTDRRFGFAAIPLAIIIAFSRLYLMVHFPTDVIGACLLGLIVSFSAICLFRRLEKKRA